MTSTAPHALPCPPWCDDRTDVHLDYEDGPDGGLHRTHSQDVGSVDGTTPGRDGERPADASIDLVAPEVIHLGPDGLHVTAPQPRVVIWAEYVMLDAAGARRVASLLLEAADKLDEILAGA